MWWTSKTGFDGALAGLAAGPCQLQAVRLWARRRRIMPIPIIPPLSKASDAGSGTSVVAPPATEL